MTRVGPRDKYHRCTDGLAGHPLDRVVVRTRWGNYSAFNGYHFTPSDYSAVYCGACGTPWRTKAAYVDDCPDEASPSAGSRLAR